MEYSKGIEFVAMGMFGGCFAALNVKRIIYLSVSLGILRYTVQLTVGTNNITFIRSENCLRSEGIAH